jgi:hypothetical protein
MTAMPQAGPRSLPATSVRQAMTRHPVTAFLVLLYAITGGLALVPTLTQPGLLPKRQPVRPPDQPRRVHRFGIPGDRRHRWAGRRT